MFSFSSWHLGFVVVDISSNFVPIVPITVLLLGGLTRVFFSVEYEDLSSMDKWKNLPLSKDEEEFVTTKGDEILDEEGF